MRLVWFALKFRMILAGEKIGVVAQLHQLGERAIGRGTGNLETFLAHPISIFHVEFITMPMAFEHFVTAVNFLGERALLNLSRPRAQAHARTFVAHSALVSEQPK